MTPREVEPSPPARFPRGGGSFVRWMRELHLYGGLFIGPFVLVFAASVFFLVHAWLPQAVARPAGQRVAADLPLPANLGELSGRERIDALRPALERAGVHGEVGWIEHFVKENRLVVPVAVPGRLTTVSIDLAKREASIEERRTGLASALIELHKSPGPHLVGLRMNWFWMRVWFGWADATVYLLLGLTVSGVCLWYPLRRERRPGLALLAAGAVSFSSLVYALLR
jgi:hypothetical protein